MGFSGKLSDNIDRDVRSFNNYLKSPRYSQLRESFPQFDELWLMFIAKVCQIYVHSQYMGSNHFHILLINKHSVIVVSKILTGFFLDIMGFRSEKIIHSMQF